MNTLEMEMQEILERGRKDYGVVSVKAEFEAEGTRLEELLRLIDIGRAAGLPLTVKIGGCEAIRDLLEAKQIGCKYIVAPMVETAYAASKFLDAKDLIYTEQEETKTEFLFNLETITGFENRQELIEVTQQGRGLHGVVLGRHDFVLSMGLPATTINDQKTTDYAIEISKLCAAADKQLVIGGGMSVESLDGIKQIHAIRLDRFETRKVVFDATRALNSDIEIGLLEAVRFEYLWLKNKQNYYNQIALEDTKRITAFEKRLVELESWAKSRKK
jgi:hypothetical protein